MIPKVAINACGLHVGGGIQVAVSFLDELTRQNINRLHVDFFVSSEVDANLRKIHSKITSQKNYFVLDTHGISTMFSRANNILSDYKVVFTIFGPSYLRSQRGVQVMGFAQLWIIDDSAYHVLGLLDKIKFQAKFIIQTLFFKNADKLIVELEHVKAGLIKAGIAKEENIEVVHNCVSSIYFDPGLWERLSIEICKSTLSLGFVGRDYPHKNINLLPAVKRILLSKHGLDVNFYVTLKDSEWSKKNAEFRRSTINVGELSLAQCPFFYKAVDGVIFPSLLECFSVTPLEAMIMKRPLFASNRRFVRDVCGDHVLYFEPQDAESAAFIIADFFRNKSNNYEDRLSLARNHALNFSNAQSRATHYLRVICEALKKAEAL